MGAWEDGFAAGYERGLWQGSAGRKPTKGSTKSARSSAKNPARRKKNPALSRAMKKAYKRSHTKSGKFRKGWNQSRMLKYAHKIKK